MVHGAVHSLLKAITAVLTIALLAVAFLVWRLSDGPVGMDFLAPYVSETLSSEQSGIVFDVREAYVEWNGFNTTPVITVLNVTVWEGEGSLLASFPEMKVAVSIKSILEGKPYPKEVVLEKPVIRFSRQESGQISLGLRPMNLPIEEQRSSDKADISEISTVPSDSANQLLNAVVNVLSDPVLSNGRAMHLNRIQVRDATVEFIDQPSGTKWIVPSGMLALERGDNRLQIDINLPYVTDGRASTLKGTGTFYKPDDLLSLMIDFQGVRPSAFSKLVPFLSVLGGADLDIDGKLGLGVEMTNSLPVLVEAQLDVTKGQGVFSLPSPLERSYPIDNLTLSALAGRDVSSFTIEDFSMSLEKGGPIVLGSLNGARSDDSLEVSGNVQINEVTLIDIKNYWPLSIKPNTRNWIASNLDGGMVAAAVFDIKAGGASLETLEVEEFLGKADIKDVDVTYLKQMPIVRETYGVMTLSKSEVVIDITSGRVTDTFSGESLEVNDGRVRLYGLDTKAHAADIDVRISGQISDALALIDSPPLGYARMLGIEAGSVLGITDTLLSVDFPLIKEVELSDVAVSATASLQDTKIDQSAFGIAVDAGQFTLAVDNLGMNIVGTGSLSGVRSGVTWRENFQGGSFRRQYALDALLDSQQLSLTGFTPTLIAPEFIKGPIRTEVIYTVNREDRETLVIEADLGMAELSIPYLNWRKAANTAALLSAEADISDGKLTSVKTFQVDSEEAGLLLSGSLEFYENGGLKSLRLDRSKIGLSEFQLVLNYLENGVIDIEARGPFLDGRAFWKSFSQSNRTRSLSDSSSTETRVPFKFSSQIDNVLLSENGPMVNVTSEIEQAATGLTHIKLEGFLEDNNSFVFDLKPSGQQRTFNARSANSGALFATLGLSQNVVDGDLLIDGMVQPDGSVSGKLSIDDFKIVNAPLLARLLSVASLTGIVDELQGDGLSFSKLNVPFSYSDRKFEIKDGAMYGASIGLTTAGQYDADRGTLSADGTIVPAYALNSAFGAIPLIGPMLTGGEEGGGVFSATYTIRGQANGGEITVNPLATLTPGFLRRIFKVFDPPPAVEPKAEEIIPDVKP